MQNHNVRKRQLSAWLLAGLSAPLAQFAGGMAWQTVAVISAVCLGGCWLVCRLEFAPPKWLCAMEYGWIVCLLGSMASWISESWVSGNAYPAVPLILLALGGASAFRGPENGARVGSIVFWLVALIYAGVVAAGAGEVELRELVYVDRTLDRRLVVALLIPVLAVFWQKEGGVLQVRGLAGIFGFAVLISALITGTLSLPVAAQAKGPLQEWVEGLSLAGTLERFESLVSVALTIGWFALLAFLISTAGQQAERVNGKGDGVGCWGAAAGAGVLALFKTGLSASVLMVGSLLFWIAAPMILAIVGKIKS